MPTLCHHRGALQTISVGYQITVHFFMTGPKIGIGKEFLILETYRGALERQGPGVLLSTESLDMSSGFGYMSIFETTRDFFFC